MDSRNLIESYLIQELFDKYYDFRLVRGNEGWRYIYEFNSESGKLYNCRFEYESEGAYSVSFAAGDYNSISRYKFKATNEGDSLRVISTVARIIKDFLKKFPDEIVSFTSHNWKLKSLYRKLTSKRLSELGLVHTFMYSTGRTYIARDKQLISDLLNRNNSK